MPRAVFLFVCLVAGLFLGYATDRWQVLGDLESSALYGVLTATLLAVGLYASTFGISLAEARRHWRLIVVAVTVGVLAKAALIGGVLVLVFDDPRFWVLGIAVAQIDPLSVAAVMRESAVSERAKTILRSWSSFDDPMTVLLAIYVPVLLLAPEPGTEVVAGGIGAYAAALGQNLALAAVIAGLWWTTRRWVVGGGVVVSVGYVLLTSGMALAVAYLLMLAVALIGLVLRPRGLEARLDPIVRVALGAAIVLVGVELVDGVDLLRGVALGAAAYGAQVVVAMLLTTRLPRSERWFIALAQQNGITALILSLMLEPAYPGTVAVVMPAIVTVNVLYALGQRVVRSPLGRERLAARP